MTNKPKGDLTFILVPPAVVLVILSVLMLYIDARLPVVNAPEYYAG